MLFNQVWADCEKDLLTEFTSHTNLDAGEVYREGPFLCVVIPNCCELDRPAMRDLIGAYEGQQPMTIAYQKCLFEFTKVCTKPMPTGERDYGGECKLILFFACTVDSNHLN
jgi:hypothetical protein